MIPDQISASDLAAYLSDKQHEAEERCDAEVVFDIADKHLEAMLAELQDPIVHKVAALLVLDRLIRWHRNMAEMNSGQTESLGWAQDSGRLSAAYDLLREVDLGKQDFTCK